MTGMIQQLSSIKFSNQQSYDRDDIVETIETDNEESLGFDGDHLVEIDANNEDERDKEKMIDNEEMVDKKVLVESSSILNISITV